MEFKGYGGNGNSEVFKKMQARIRDFNEKNNSKLHSAAEHAETQSFPEIAINTNEIILTPEVLDRDILTIIDLIERIGVIDQPTLAHSIGLAYLLKSVLEKHLHSKTNTVEENTDTDESSKRKRQEVRDLHLIMMCGILHDIGKRVMPTVVNSPRALRQYVQNPQQEMAEMRNKFGVNALNDSEAIEELLKNIAKHALTRLEDIMTPSLKQHKNEFIQHIVNKLSALRKVKEITPDIVSIIIRTSIFELAQEEIISHKDRNQFIIGFLTKPDEFRVAFRQQIIEAVIQTDKILISHDRQIINEHPEIGFQKILEALSANKNEISAVTFAYIIGVVLMHHNPNAGDRGYPSKEIIHSYVNNYFADVDEAGKEELWKTILSVSHIANKADILHAVSFDNRLYRKPPRADINAFIAKFKNEFDETQNQTDNNYTNYMGWLLHHNPDFFTSILPNHDQIIAYIHSLAGENIGDTKYIHFEDVLLNKPLIEDLFGHHLAGVINSRNSVST